MRAAIRKFRSDRDSGIRRMARANIQVIVAAGVAYNPYELFRRMTRANISTGNRPVAA